MTSRTRYATWLAIFSLGACGGGSTTATAPNPPSTPVAAAASPRPSPTPDANAVAAAAGCVPTPSRDKLYGFRVKVHNPQGFKNVLNASPFVRDAEYCRSIGEPTEFCFTRAEGTAEREPCDIHMAGIEPQTNRPGPIWKWNGQICRYPGEGGSDPGCVLHPTNPFLAFAYGPGYYEACGGQGTNGSCGNCQLDPNSAKCRYFIE